MTSSSTSNISTNNPTPTPKPTTSSPARTPPPAAVQACAACKYQRRRCVPNCPLAPYFPADQQRQFLNAHRLFGVSNILKALRSLPDPGDREARNAAMGAILFQSNARAADPVGGCYRIILDLQRQIDLCSLELSLVLRQLAVFKSNSTPIDSLALYDQQQEEEPQQQPQQHQQQQQYFDYFYYENIGNSVGGDDGNGSFGLNVGSDGGGLEMEMLSFDHQKEEEEDAKPLLLDVFDVRQAFDDEVSNGAAAAVPAADDVADFGCSIKTSELKGEADAIEHIQEHDLKEAASLFTLTNCNTSTV